MATQVPTVSGKLQAIIGPTGEQGSVEIALCGHGSQVPRMNGTGMGAKVTDGDNLTVNTDGTFTFNVTANDFIQPDGTYYTVTVKDANGDISQVNAYRFTSDNAAYNLDSLPPIDANSPPPPVITPLVNLLETVPYSANPVFDGTTYASWLITLQGDATATFQNLVDGNLYTLLIEQNSAGGHKFTFPANVINPTEINLKPNGVTIQTYVAVDGNMVPVGAATWCGGPV